MTKQTPMGVSQWRNYGKKLGYWSYFEDEVRKEIGKEFKKWFNGNWREDVEDVVERITGVKV